MQCCELGVFLLVFAVLIGCDQSSKSPKAASLPPLLAMEPAEESANDATYRWQHQGKDTACRIPLPNRTSFPVTLRFRQDEIEGQPVGILFLDSEYQIEIGKILSDQVMIFVRPGDVIPFHDQLYHVTFDSNSVVLRRVTHLVPQIYHPHPEYLVISLTEPVKIREKLFRLESDDWSDYERVRITHIAEDASRADYEGKPYYGSAQGEMGGKTFKLNDVVHQWSNSTTDVVGIVPPVEIEGVGKLRGWVEFRQVVTEE